MSPSRYRLGDCGTTDRDAAVDPFTAVVYYGGVQVLLFGLPVLWLAFLSTAAPRLGVAVLVALPVAAIVVAAGRAGLLPGGLRRLSVRRLWTGRGYRTFCRRAAHLQATLALAVFGGAAAGYAAVTAPLVVTTLLAAVGTALARPLARGARATRAGYYLAGLAVAVAVVTRLPVLPPTVSFALAVFAAVVVSVWRRLTGRDPVPGSGTLTTARGAAGVCSFATPTSPTAGPATYASPAGRSRRSRPTSCRTRASGSSRPPTGSCFQG
jgi:hypothetical protein